MTLLGNHERISAARALEIGLVTEVVPMAELAAPRPSGSPRPSRRSRRPPCRPACARCGRHASSPGADARRRQHLPQPGHEQGGPRRGPAGVRVRRSASTPRSGDARRHRAGGRAGASGRARPSSTPTARACRYAALDAPLRRGGGGDARGGRGAGRRGAAAPAVGLDLRVAYAAAAKVGAITAGVNPRLAPPEQEAVAAVAGGALTLTTADEVEALRRPGARGTARARRGPRRSRSCSPRAPPGSRRGRCSASGSSPPSPASTSPMRGATRPPRRRRCWPAPSSPTSGS